MSLANFPSSVGATGGSNCDSARPSSAIQHGAYAGEVVGTGGGLPVGVSNRQQYGNVRDGELTLQASRRRSQQRAGRWRSSGGRYLQSVRSRFRSFRKGSSKYLKTVHPTREEVLRASVAETAPGGVSAPPSDSDVIFVPGTLKALSEEQAAVNDLLRSVKGKGDGFVEDRKPADAIRLYAENVNSFSLFNKKKKWKLDRVLEINSRYQTDGALFLECGTDFRQVSSDVLQERIGDQDCISCTANNVTEQCGRSQQGGTAVFAYPRLSGFIMDKDKDSSGLGRWSWFLLGTPERRTRLVSAYCPVRPPSAVLRDKRKGHKTVWSQHVRHFRKTGRSGSPRECFLTDLVDLLLLWRSQGDEIVLFVDTNEHANKGHLATRLSGPDLMMREQFLSLHGRSGPASYFRGSKPLDGCYCTPGVDCLNVLVSPHQAGAGDHRYWILDFDAKSLIGAGYPHLVRPKGRRLKCTVHRARKSYTKKLRRLSVEHRMFEKMESMILASEQPGYCADDLAARMNSFDMEHTQQQYAAENQCNYFKNDFLEFSPEVNLWKRRKELYDQLLSINARKAAGKRVPTSHFVRSCRNNGIDAPFSLSTAEVEARLVACNQRLLDLRPVAPQLRTSHLRTCLSNAQAKGNERAVRRIKQIMRDERGRKRWKGVRRATTARRGGAPTAIRMQTPDGQPDAFYDSRAEVESNAARRLTDRFKLARDAPICEGPVFDDIGYLGNTRATRAILEGTYDFPPEMDTHTRLLLEEAHKVFSTKTAEEISTFVSVEDFQYFWRRADEFIQSSYSHIHFGHYKAIAHDRFLSSLQAAKLSLAARTGIPLDRWGAGLTVLIEKEFGNIYLEKMRAIVLLEADMNWLNKLVFAKRMMDRAYDQGLVPVDQFARRGTQAAHGVLCKALFCDMVRALHVVAGIPSVDLGNCYDAVAHPIASIALQAFMVPVAMVVMSLTVLQSMQFFLRTGYGVSEKGYGGSQSDPTFGLGQGNGMAPSGFQTVSTLMTATYISAWVMPRP